MFQFCSWDRRKKDGNFKLLGECQKWRGSYISLLQQSLEFHYRDDGRGRGWGWGWGVHESCRAQNTTGKKTLLQPDVLSCEGGIITPSAIKQVNFDTGRPVAVAIVPKRISYLLRNLTVIPLTAPNTQFHQHYLSCNRLMCGSGSSVGIATGYGMDGPGSNPRGGEIFRSCPDRPWGPPSLLYNGYRVFPGGIERLGRDADSSPPSSTVVKKE